MATKAASYHKSHTPRALLYVMHYVIPAKVGGATMASPHCHGYADLQSFNSNVTASYAMPGSLQAYMYR